MDFPEVDAREIQQERGTVTGVNAWGQDASSHSSHNRGARVPGLFPHGQSILGYRHLSFPACFEPAELGAWSWVPKRRQFGSIPLTRHSGSTLIPRLASRRRVCPALYRKEIYIVYGKE